MSVPAGGRAAAASALLLVALPAHAGRPFATEDAGVLGAFSCEVEAYVARETARNVPRLTGWWIQPGCGLGLNSQVSLGAGRTSGGGESITAFALLGKTFVRELRDDRYGFTLAYQVTGQRTSVQSLRYDGADARAVYTQPVRGALVSVNLGWNRVREGRIDSTVWAVAIEAPVATGLDLGAETFGDDRTAPWLGVGARYAVVPEQFFVDFSWAVQTDSARTKLLTVGLKLATP